MLYILVFLDVASLTRNDDDDALRLQDDSGLYVASHGASGYDGRACPEVAPREAVVALAVVEEDGAVEMVVSIKAVVEMAIWKWGNVSPRPKSSKTMSGGGGGDWVRGQAMPPQKQWQQQGNNNPCHSHGGRGGYGGGPQPLYDGPVVPLVKTENHWCPKKNSIPLVVAEKSVKAILNKMTTKKFERLAQQMIEIEISSYDMLTMMIENVNVKAIDEPSFGNIYADICVKLSETASSFVHITESDEEPPTES